MAPPQPQPGVLDIEAYVGGKARLRERADVAKLSANESPLGPSPKAIEAYHRVGARLHRYPDGASSELRAAIGELHGVDADRIVCGAGSDELISLLARAYAGPGDEVVHSAHGFLMYRLAALAAGATPVAAPEAALTTSVDALLGALTPRTRLVFLANPNNPTGTYLGRNEILRLRSRVPEHVLIVLDAAYTEYVDRSDYDDGMSLVAGAENVVVLRTFSKIMGLAALRLGWAYAPAAVVDVLNRVRGPFNVSAAAQQAGLAALRDREHVVAAKHHNDQWLPWLEARLRQLGFEVVPSVANFLLVTTRSRARAQEVLRVLEVQGVLARDMGAYGLPDSVRLSVGTEMENRRVVAALADVPVADVA